MNEGLGALACTRQRAFACADIKRVKQTDGVNEWASASQVQACLKDACHLTILAQGWVFEKQTFPKLLDDGTFEGT